MALRRRWRTDAQQTNSARKRTCLYIFVVLVQNPVRKKSFSEDNSYFLGKKILILPSSWFSFWVRKFESQLFSLASNFMSHFFVLEFFSFFMLNGPACRVAHSAVSLSHPHSPSPASVPAGNSPAGKSGIYLLVIIMRKKEREREIVVDKKMIPSLLPSQTVNEFLIQSEILEMPSSTDTSKFFFGSKVSFLRISEAWCCCDDDDDYKSSDGSCWLFKLAQSAQAFSCPRLFVRDHQFFSSTWLSSTLFGPT